jgi:hypothetical protein
MTSRTLATTVAGRSSSMRRQRRRVAASTREYCRTNGCASFLGLDPADGALRCPICGYVQRPV